MYSEELKNTLENARINKDISQRELSKLAGISRSTLNDLINGKIKKVDVGVLKKLAEVLDLSLEKLLKVAGYNDFLDFLSSDKLKNKSTVDLKNIIEQYRKSELDLLDFDFQKRRTIRLSRNKLFQAREELRKIKENPKDLYKIDKVIDDIASVSNELKDAQIKYDYSKLPRK